MTDRSMVQHSFSVTVTADSTSGLGRAMEYLTSGILPTQDGVKIAVGCVFGPLGSAIAGRSLEEVEADIELARVQFESFMNLARDLCAVSGPDFHKNVRFDGAIDITAVEGASQPSVESGSGHLQIEEADLE